MRRLIMTAVPLTLWAFSSYAVAGDPVYREKNQYPVLDEMTAARETAEAVRDSIRDEVDAIYEADTAARDAAALSLRVDWSQIESPDSPAEFDQIWHTPPTPQFYTGTCWAFCSTIRTAIPAFLTSKILEKISSITIGETPAVGSSRSITEG